MQFLSLEGDKGQEETCRRPKTQQKDEEKFKANLQGSRSLLQNVLQVALKEALQKGEEVP